MNPNCSLLSYGPSVLSNPFHTVLDFSISYTAFPSSASPLSHSPSSTSLESPFSFSVERHPRIPGSIYTRVARCIWPRPKTHRTLGIRTVQIFGGDSVPHWQSLSLRSYRTSSEPPEWPKSTAMVSSHTPMAPFPSRTAQPHMRRSTSWQITSSVGTSWRMHRPER